VLSLSEQVDRPDELGFALSRSGAVTAEEELALLKDALASSHPPIQSFGRGYVAGFVAQQSSSAMFDVLRNRAGDWPSTTRARALLALPADAATFQEVGKLDEAGQQRYWEELYPHRVDDAEVEFVLRKLLQYGRPHAAVDLASTHGRGEKKFDPEVLAEAITAAARAAKDPDGTRADSYDFGRILDELETASAEGRLASERVAQLEFALLPLVGRFERPPRVLEAELAHNPALFAEAVGYAYRAEDEPARELSDEEEVRAELSYQLLDIWREIPGLENGRVDPEQLRTWVSTARQLLRDSGRTEVGDHLIGQMLSGAPPGEDGVCPAEAVRGVIETVQSEALEQGLYVGRLNSRGVVTKALLTGGDPERGLAAHYEGDAAKLDRRWPRTAAVLRRIASAYRRDAQREDEDATLRHDLWG
jgi:hypothetical protein